MLGVLGLCASCVHSAGRQYQLLRLLRPIYMCPLGADKQETYDRSNTTTADHPTCIPVAGRVERDEEGVVSAVGWCC